MNSRNLFILLGDDCAQGKDSKTGKNVWVCRYHCSKDGCNKADLPQRNQLFVYILAYVSCLLTFLPKSAYDHIYTTLIVSALYLFSSIQG